jgi:hypothetical protein
MNTAVHIRVTLTAGPCFDLIDLRQATTSTRWRIHHAV